MNTLANKITVARVVMIPLFLALLYLGLPSWAFAVYVLACLSDAADGYIARHYNQITNFGKFMDPLADKILVLSALCVFAEQGLMPGWCVALVLFREFAVSGLRLIAVEQGKVIAAAWSGKIKTACTMVAIGAMLLFSQNRTVNSICIVLILVTTVYSGLEYFYVNRDVFQDFE